jgi:hypothetical protein
MPCTDTAIQPTATPAYGDLRIAPSLVRPGKIELHLYEVFPSPARGGWFYVDEFATEAEARAQAREIDPEVRIHRLEAWAQIIGGQALTKRLRHHIARTRKPSSLGAPHEH